MPKLQTFSGKQLIQLLTQHGFDQIRLRGSHIVLQKRVEAATVTVIVPDHRDIKVGTLLSGSRACREACLSIDIDDSEPTGIAINS